MGSRVQCSGCGVELLERPEVCRLCGGRDFTPVPELGRETPRVFDFTPGEPLLTEGMSVQGLRLAPGQGQAVHRHFTGDQAILLLQGELEVLDEGGTTGARIGSGQGILIPKDRWHGFENRGTDEATFIEVTGQPAGLAWRDEAGHLEPVTKEA